MTSLVNAGLLDVVEETINLGAEPARARSWWLGEVSRLANEREVDPTTFISPEQVAEVIALIVTGDLTDKLARQVVEGVIAGEGTPADVIAQRGLKVVSDDGALMTAIEAAIAAQPDTAERVRGGNIPAAGALIGAVMKATGGQADAAKVRELLLKHLGQGE
jgi:aspartyl-tRNA(Asn)/glutamyl-tRNA(Gln) amidotransferase subunit B